MRTITRLTTLAAAAGLGVAATAIAVDADGGATRAGATIVDATGEPVGFAWFTEDANGALHVNVKVHDMAPGLHGIHVHAVGSCASGFAAAGTHHNPLGAKHGHHSGDLPNLIVNEDGNGRLNAVTTAATLTAGQLSLLDANGSAIVVHASQDDYVTDPTGNSGARIACGVVVAR